MKNNNLNLINLLPFYKKETKKTKDNKTNISKINLLKQNNLNTNPISNNKKLNLYLKGLIIYIKNINSYTLKWNNKNLILNLKKNLPQIELPLSHLNKNIIIDTSNKEQLRIESIRLIYNYLNKNLPSFKSNAITNVDIKLLNNKIDEQSSNSLITNKENTILNNEITIPENNNIQKFFKNIELMTKERLKENKNLIINNKKLNSNTESLYPQIIKTTNIRDYLKSITIFNNNISKGKELKFYQEKSYNFNNLNNKLIKKMYDFLQNSFITMNSLISKPLLDITPNKIIIHLFFYHFNIKNTYFKSRWNPKVIYLKRKLIKDKMNGEIFIKKNSKKLKQVCQILSLNFKKPIELELTRIYYPYLDSNIFVNFLALMINKKKVRHIMKKFFKKAAIKNLFKFVNQNKNTNVPSLLSGIKILIAGRLLTHKAIPRKTVKIIKRGAFAKSKVNYVDIARYTNKNRRGAFSITVTTGQNLFI